MVGSARALASFSTSRDTPCALKIVTTTSFPCSRVSTERTPLSTERLDDVAIVNDLVAHVDRSAMLGQRPLDNIDRPNNASAKPARLGKNDLHSPAFSPKASMGLA